MTFGQTLKTLRAKSGKSRYRLAQYSGLNEPYVLRLESGERQNLSRDAVMKLGLALVATSEAKHPPGKRASSGGRVCSAAEPGRSGAHRLIRGILL